MPAKSLELQHTIRLIRELDAEIEEIEAAIGRVPEADVFSGVIEGIAEIAGASLLHMGIAVFELPGLVGNTSHGVGL